jgi:hypothetical protein
MDTNEEGDGCKKGSAADCVKDTRKKELLCEIKVHTKRERKRLRDGCNSTLSAICASVRYD